MTLILSFKVADAMVIAADSLSSVSGRTVCCTTRKIHKVGASALAGGAGKSMIMGEYWSEILPRFSPADTRLEKVAEELRLFLDGVISKVPDNPIGGRQGGNTFILVGSEASGGHGAATFLQRIGNNRSFEPNEALCSESESSFLHWAGDTTDRIAAHMAAVERAYDPAMTKEEAIDFARNAIIGAIQADQAAGGTTIGGEFVLIGTAYGGTVELIERPTGIACELSPIPDWLAGLSPR